MSRPVETKYMKPLEYAAHLQKVDADLKLYDNLYGNDRQGNPEADATGFSTAYDTWAEKKGTAAEMEEHRAAVEAGRRLAAAAAKVSGRSPSTLLALASVPEARLVQPSCCPTSIRLPRVYIAGPMRGYPANNAAAFFAAHYAWAAAGWEVLNPALVDLENPLITEADVPDPDSHDEGSTGNWRELVMRDCEMVCKADAIAFLQGYRASSGAEAEWHLASWLNLPMYYQEEDGKWR